MLDWISTHIPPWVWITLAVHGAIMGTVAYLILLERKVASWTQDRLGPNRVGPFGLLQPIADGLKFILKEDYRARHTDKILFTLAPAIMVIVIILSIATLPWGGTKQSSRRVTVPTQSDWKVEARKGLPAGVTVVDAREIDHIDPGTNLAGEYIPRMSVVETTYRWNFQISNLNIGVLFILAVLSLAIYGVVLGGWASNNKYSFLGGLRATAQMISYEIPLGVAVLTIVVLYGTLDLNTIVAKQAHYWAGFIPAWNVFTQPLAFLMFLVCIHAEANRAPFDLAEAEQELVGGYHTEYSAMRFALFFLGEYAGMITTSMVCVALFFGGWHIPWLDLAWPKLFGDPSSAHPEIVPKLWVCILRSIVIFSKAMFIIFVFMWVRWSLPRFRFDQLMHLAWRALIPISLAILLMTAFVLYFAGPQSAIFMDLNKHWIDGQLAAIFFVCNIILLAVVMIASRLVPPAPDTNRRMQIANSRFTPAPMPLTTGN
jgi:NADH-quinone oxidoreductase subunit H